jgi:hypothetical protein
MNFMNSGRRIAAAVLSAALSMGAIGFSAAPAQAYKDTTWPASLAPDTKPSLMDTTWPSVQDIPDDTTWPTRG